MKTEDKTHQEKIEPPTPGFFTRIFTKIDDKMKAKADEAAKNECCSGGKNDKGGKCC